MSVTTTNDVLVIARRRAFWATKECAATFSRTIFLPSVPSKITYPGYFLILLAVLLWSPPKILIIGTTMPISKWIAFLRRRGLFKNIRLLTDHQFLPSRDVAAFDTVWTYSHKEFERYDVSVRDRLVFLRYPSKALLVDVRPSSGDYVLSSGNHKRDHGSFLKAMEGLRMPGVVVTQNNITHPIPSNCTLRTFLPLEDYYQLMAGARFVVVPLAESAVPHGHCDISGALSMGKAVITTKDASADDYVRDGVNGLLVSPGDVLGYRKAIKRVYEDEALRAELEKGARETAPVLTYSHFAKELEKLALGVHS